MNKRNITLRLEIFRCPIFNSDINNGEIYTGIEVIDNDPIVKEINYKLGNKYNDYFEFNSNDKTCYFNEEQLKRDKNVLIELTKQLKNRLNKINDGSYIVIDNITDYLNKILN